MSRSRVTCERGFPAAVRVGDDDGASWTVLTRLRYRVDAGDLVLEEPSNQEAVFQDQSIAHHDFESVPWLEMLAQGKTMVRVPADLSDESRSFDVPASVFTALQSALAETLQPGSRVAIPDPRPATGYRIVNFDGVSPWIYQGAEVRWLRVVAFDIDPSQSSVYATFAARAKAEPGCSLHVSLEPPVGDEVTADIDSVRRELASGRGYSTGAMAARVPNEAMPFRPSSLPQASPPAPQPEPSPVAQPIPTSPPPLPPRVGAPPPAIAARVRGPDAARPLLDEERSVSVSSLRPQGTPKREAPRNSTALELLWHDADRVEAMEASPHLRDSPGAGATSPKRRRLRRPRRKNKAEDKRPESFVVALLRHSPSAITSSLRTLLQESLGAEDDSTARPMVMVEGALHLCFDPREELTTLVSLARPLARAGGKLADEIDHVDALLETPIEGAPDVARRMADRIRQSWSDANQSLPTDYLSTTTERVLLSKRAYQKVQLFGGRFLRSEVGTREGDRIVTYIPDDVGPQLPLFPVLPVRVIAIAHLRQDIAEKGSASLRCIALARRSDRA